LAELKTRLWPEGATSDTVSDTVLETIITSVSREIDALCGRRFWTTDTTETRYFTAHDPTILFPEVDIVSITSIAVDYDGSRAYSTTMDTADYDLLPANAAVDSIPYSWIEIAPMGDESFPTHRNGVKVVGYFGWSAVPAAVEEATLIQCQRVWKRRDSPFGVISNPAGGDMRLLEKIDPDVQALLWNYRKVV
jgi:hypothetical protein